MDIAAIDRILVHFDAENITYERALLQQRLGRFNAAVETEISAHPKAYCALLKANGCKKNNIRPIYSLFGFLDGTPVRSLQTPAEKGAFLIKWNRVFKTKFMNPNDVVKNISGNLVVQILEQVEACGFERNTSFQKYLAGIAGGSWAAFCVAVQEWVEGGRTIGQLMALIERYNLTNLPMEYLIKNEPRELDGLIRLCPPTPRWQVPFTGWGVGNHLSIKDNVKEHFRKHVLDAENDLDDKTECRVWWRKLNIRPAFKRNVVEGLVGLANQDTLLGFFGADGILPEDQITPFLAAAQADLVQKKASKLLQWFDGDGQSFIAAYKDEALSIAADLTDLAVVEEKGRLFVSGYKKVDGAPFFVIGRVNEYGEGWDSAKVTRDTPPGLKRDLSGYVLTISSCYRATDIDAKLAERNVLWTSPA